jgi:UPF0755 protein
MVVRRVGVWLVVASAVLIGALIAAYAWLDGWRTRPVHQLKPATTVVIAQGATVSRIAAQLAAAGLFDEPRLFVLLARVQHAGNRLQAGEYAFDPGVTPQDVLDRLVAGTVVQHQLTLVEGRTFDDALATIRAHEAIATTPTAEEQFRRSLPASAQGPEGRLFPDTYTFPRGATDIALLVRAGRRLEEQLAQAWRDRAPECILKSADEALVLASVVEKETGIDDERPLIAGVFLNRLRIGMRLQSDPTVIYGVGRIFDGDLRRDDLRRDTPYNTYTRRGLPPTPIALAGAAALRAATRPARTDALYFVATGTGDGRHRFAATLEEHNRNVARYLAAQRSSER